MTVADEVAVGTSGMARGSEAKAHLMELFEGHRLTPTQRRIAHHLLTNADQAPYLSVTALADLAHVSQPSVTRFASALGYDGYPALREAIRSATAAGRLSDTDVTLNEWQRAIELEQAGLASLKAELANEEPVRAAAGILARSQPLTVLGLGSAGPIAQYFSHLAAKVLPDVRTVSGLSVTGIAEGLEQARAAGGTALLACLLPRYERHMVDMIRVAASLGFEIVCVTDGPHSPARELADQVLYAPVRSSLVFDSLAVPVTLLMVILQAICDEIPQQAMARLEAYDQFASGETIYLD